jgi:hypothetical protein
MDGTPLHEFRAEAVFTEDVLREAAVHQHRFAGRWAREHLGGILPLAVLGVGVGLLVLETIGAFDSAAGAFARIVATAFLVVVVVSVGLILLKLLLLIHRHAQDRKEIAARASRAATKQYGLSITLTRKILRIGSGPGARVRAWSDVDMTTRVRDTLWIVFDDGVALPIVVTSLPASTREFLAGMLGANLVDERAT